MYGGECLEYVELFKLSCYDFCKPPTRPTFLVSFMGMFRTIYLSMCAAHWVLSGWKHWPHVGGGTGSGLLWSACTARPSTRMVRARVSGLVVHYEIGTRGVL